MVSGRLVTLMPIKKMNRAIRFYTKALGGRLKDRARGEMKDMWASVNVGKHEVWLIAPAQNEKRKLAYSTFLVNNIKSAVNALKKKGVKFEKAEKMGPESRIEGSITYEQWGASAFFKDTEGNLLMVWQNFPPM